MEYGIGKEMEKESIIIIREWEKHFNRDIVELEYNSSNKPHLGEYILHLGREETLNREELQYLFERFLFVTVGIDSGKLFVSLTRK
ncbi:MAG: hypothetical protein IJE43_18090 [Alphaproteobacteria bacterium]|nr:hypothetical protein [Alphaproteobacteria bacterium]MBQ6688728.1 hypothetical protein [Bacteroidales bacterium]